MSETTERTEVAGTVGGRFEDFVGTIARLRAPGGCPWDREQTHASIARNMAEEAYEAIDAIERNDVDDLREELGDVLLQVVLQSQMASEEGAFDIGDVITDVNEKMIRRHPHVFGDDAAFAAAHLTDEQVERIRATRTPGQVLDLWDQIKLIEKQQKAERRGREARRGQEGAAGAGSSAPTDGQASAPTDASGTNDTPAGLLDGVPQALPALMQAQDISRKAVSVGFEWPDVASVWEQVASEIEEYRAEERGSAAAAAEFGDVLFSLVNVARKEGIDAESALRSTCRKFRGRWAIMERNAQTAGKHVSEYTVDGLEELWQAAKGEEDSEKF
jgi:tetrapyrrole methylase family protein/MazG family protein